MVTPDKTLKPAPRCTTKEEINAQSMFAELREVAKAGNGATFDSDATADYIKRSFSSSESKMPEGFLDSLEAMPEDKRASVVGVILDGVNEYEKMHGQKMPADLYATAIRYVSSLNPEKMGEANMYDSLSIATSQNMVQENRSLQPERVITAVIGLFSESPTWVYNLPTKMGSNEARLAIVSHYAGDTFGGYKANDSLNGINSGLTYADGSRFTRLAESSGNWTGKITSVQGAETCDPAADALPLLQGRTIIYVNGKPVALEVQGSPEDASLIAGSYGSHAIQGKINLLTGAVEVKFTPAIVGTTHVVAEAYIDYQKKWEIIPSIKTGINVYSLFAHESRLAVEVGQTATTQASNELGVDLFSESTQALHKQYHSERHYAFLRKALWGAQPHVTVYNYNWAVRQEQMNRHHIWVDFRAALKRASQEMAERTQDHGISHLYVGKELLSQLQCLPPDLFASSGVTERPGIYRAGRLFGQYEVYYSPRYFEDNSGASEVTMLCIGQGTSAPMNPIVTGDAVAPLYMPIGPTNKSLNRTGAFYARGYGNVNPFDKAADSFSLIKITGLN